MKPTVVDPNEILSIDKALTYLNTGKTIIKDHTIKSGEVLSDVASDYNISLDKLLKLNPSLSIDSILQINQKIKVGVTEPLLHLVTVEQIKKKEIIQFEIEKIEDPSLPKGETVIKQSGEVGSKEVIYEVTKENGKVTNTSVLKEAIIKSPRKKIMEIGTKVIPSRGTGNFQWPTVGGVVTSRTGSRWGKLHKGTDIAGPSKLSILAADNGKVTFAGWNGGYGNKIIIDHNNGYKTLYAHMATLKVKVGQVVSKGEEIGIMGSTGNSTGTHLHIELYKNGRLADFLNYLN